MHTNLFNIALSIHIVAVVRVHLDGRGGGVHGGVHPLHHARAHRRYRLDPRLQLQQVQHSRQPRQPVRGEMGGRELELYLYI